MNQPSLFPTNNSLFQKPEVANNQQISSSFYPQMHPLFYQQTNTQWQAQENGDPYIKKRVY